MKLIDNIKPIGRLTIAVKGNGEIIRIIRVDNLITYIGSGILAHCLGGESQYKISHIYGEYVPQGVGYSEGSLNGMEAKKTDTIDTLRTSPRATEYAESEILFSSYNSSSQQYNNNVITFAASWNNANLANKLLQGAGLIVQNNNLEYLYAHAYFPAILIQSGQELVCHWSQLFI